MSEHTNQTIAPAESRGSAVDIEAEIRAALEMSDEDFADWKSTFIDRRIEQLTPAQQPDEISSLSKPVQEFIGPRTEVKPKFIGRGFKLDDPEIYHAWLDTMREMYQAHNWQDPLLHRSLVFYSIQYGLQKYTGSVIPSDEMMADRESRLWDSAIINAKDDAGPQPVSIAEHKEQAMCTERAAIAHNILCINEINNIFYNGKLTVSEEGTDEELHSYLIYESSEGKHMIYDPTNPEFIVEDGKVVGMLPAIYEGGEAILSGQDVETEHKKYAQNGVIVSFKKYIYRHNKLCAHMVK